MTSDSRPEQVGEAALQDTARFVDHSALVDAVRKLIDSSRSLVARTVNSEIVTLYWRIGERIRREELQGERAAYGKRVLESLAGSLTAEYGRGFTLSALSRMTKFAEIFPSPEILATLSQELSWIHLRSSARETDGNDDDI